MVLLHITPHRVKPCGHRSTLTRNERNHEERVQCQARCRPQTNDQSLAAIAERACHCSENESCDDRSNERRVFTGAAPRYGGYWGNRDRSYGFRLARTPSPVCEGYAMLRILS
jgi:hypothetical protein